MRSISIPGSEDLRLAELVSDLDGTPALDGRPVAGAGKEGGGGHGG